MVLISLQCSFVVYLNIYSSVSHLKPIFIYMLHVHWSVQLKTTAFSKTRAQELQDLSSLSYVLKFKNNSFHEDDWNWAKISLKKIGSHSCLSKWSHSEMSHSCSKLLYMWHYAVTCQGNATLYVTFQLHFLLAVTQISHMSNISWIRNIISTLSWCALFNDLKEKN